MRSLGLDLLRFAAIVFVIGSNLRLPASGSELFSTWKMGGWIGVDMFFVLSGFLVSGLLFKEYQVRKSIDIKRFVIRRGFKKYPGYYLFVAAFVVANILTFKSTSKEAILSEAFFLQNYLGGLGSQSWPLAVEEHFYLGLSALFLLLLRFRRSSASPFSKIPLLFFLVAVLCLGLRIAGYFIYKQYSPEKFLFPTHLRIDSLLFGTLLAYLWYFQELRERTAGVSSWLLWVGGINLMVPAFVFPIQESWFAIFYVILLYLGSGLLILAALRIPPSQNIALKVLAALGAARYSIFLWHLLLAKLLTMSSYQVYFSLYLVGSLALGWLTHKIREVTVLKLRDRLLPLKA